MNYKLSKIYPLLLVFLLWNSPLQAQIVNFTPLEKGEYEEEEEKLFILRGMEVEGGYAMRLSQIRHDTLPSNEETTRFKQNFRLNFRTVFHRDAALHLNLKTSPANIENDNLRVADEEESNRIGETQPLALSASEAFFRYRFNPGSALIVGKHELSIGDRRGKVFHGILPAITFDCKVGTWCMPFGGGKTGSHPADWIFHWALEYTAWDEKFEGIQKKLQVEIFRIKYSESNVPLGKNQGPAMFNKNYPDSDTSADPSQEVDSQGYPIYYDANSQQYFGLRVDWKSSLVFMNFDMTFYQGGRYLHRYNEEPGTMGSLDLDGHIQNNFKQRLSGRAWESEFGFQWPKLIIGLRVMRATGDSALLETNKYGLRAIRKGFYEVTPGSYQGTRLYFNGIDSDITSGAGLGHSINNTRFYGFFLKYVDPEDTGLDYSLGIYQLKLNKPIYDVDGLLRDDIGLEVNNLLAFYLHKAVQLQFEANIIQTKEAFRFDDFSAPATKNRMLQQGIIRLVYQF